MKNVIIGLLAAALLVGIIFFFFLQRGDDPPVVEEHTTEDTTATSTNEVEAQDDTQTTIGRSVEGRDIVAYHYGDGETELLFIGGIHGGYSWNTVLVAYELMEYLKENENAVPEDVRVTVIPVMNPDGLESVVGTTTANFNVEDIPEATSVVTAGRFNENNVDLNRNFDCDWQPESTWQSRTVSGGSAAFSEPESQAIRDFVSTLDPDAVVVWYSAAGGVFASNCHGGVLPQTTELTDLYAEAAGYRSFREFDFYDITGDMVNWFAKEGIPAISVLLTNHEDVEWNKNRAGIEAIFEYYTP